ncbi:MAG TPA: hypothetical protein VJB02_01685 [Coxiellaceae bacterium]|nr:hypothetical protein [Coxiellaceae bacterium]
MDKITSLDWKYGNLQINITQTQTIIQACCQDNQWLRADPIPYDSDEDHYWLHAGKEGEPIVLLIVWAPRTVGIPHNHKTWAVVGCIKGCEKHVFWNRLDDRTKQGYAKLARGPEIVCSPNRVITMQSDDIHHVENQAGPGKITLSLHVYGTDITQTGREQFNIEKQTVSLMTGLK